MKNLITLHEAIVLAIISKDDRTATYPEIAEFIDKRGLYTERKGNIALSDQVKLRATQSRGNYRRLFEVIEKETIRLRNL